MYCDSPIGRLLLEEKNSGIVGVWLEGQKYFLGTLRNEVKEDNNSPILLQTKKWLEQYFANGEPSICELPLAPISSDFHEELLRLTRETSPMPIIAIVPKLTVPEKIAFFHAGTNVCLKQPINIILCVAQAYALIQLYLDATKANNKIYPVVFDTELIINPIYRHVIIDRKPLELTRTEFDLLYFMAKHPNQIFSRQQLYWQIWGDDLGISGKNTVRSHIGNIYKKLVDVGKNYIQNTRGAVINLFLLLVKNKLEHRTIRMGCLESLP